MSGNASVALILDGVRRRLIFPESCGLNIMTVKHNQTKVILCYQFIERGESAIRHRVPLPALLLLKSTA